MKNKPIQLAAELKTLVSDTVAILGEVIKEEAGLKLYHVIETIRKDMTVFRSSSSAKKETLLNEVYKKCEKLNQKQTREIAHAYTLMLELINVCESAFRTFKIKQKKDVYATSKQSNMLVYVITAHPTEARTPQNIELFRRIQGLLLRILENSGEKEYLQSIIKHNLKVAWLIPITKHEKPTVLDEARHLYSIILREDIFDTLLRANRDYANIRVRTWVGGDKDGHPGVDEKVMMECLNLSRAFFVKTLRRLLKDYYKDIHLLHNDKLESEYSSLIKNLQQISKILPKDDLRVAGFVKALLKLDSNYKKIVGMQSPRIRKIEQIFEMFPGLVIPIELREDSEIIAQFKTSKSKIAIERMLCKLSEIASGKNLRNYAQGLIISMCQTFEDFKVTCDLQKKVFKGFWIPVIPLFETADALENSSEIISHVLKYGVYLKSLKGKFNNRLEVMLGYSDSSKGMGVFPSRLGIAKTMRSLDSLIRTNGVTPIFFHGSGGSVDRGGGSIKDQVAWWPRSALEIYKATVQGEMVERSFNSPEITLSGISKVLKGFENTKAKDGFIKLNKHIEFFAKDIANNYVQMIKDPDFFKMVESATPYSYLSALKLGSRPTKRSKAKVLDFSSIRAIPWILCWTQTRLLFPTWWGVGSAWKNFENKKNLKAAYKQSNLFQSFVRLLGFTLMKVDIEVFKLYLNRSSLSEKEKADWLKIFQAELKLCHEFVYEITGEKNVLWHTPWLADSITLRSSMIHPLNVLQLIAHKKEDMILLRKTVAGISSGMMTTG